MIRCSPHTPLKSLENARIWHQQGRLEQAENAYREVLDVDPLSQPIWQALADIELQRLHEHALDHASYGRLDEAARLWKEAVSMAPEQLGYYMSLLRNNPHDAEAQEAVLDIGPKAVPHDLRQVYYWCRYKVWEARGNYELAWLNLELANEIKRAALSYDEVSHLQYYGRIVASFNTRPPMGRYYSQYPIPIFIIGLPRSGTTLVEQIIASHPEVKGLGELPHLEDLTVGKHPTQWGDVAKPYLDLLPKVNCPYVTDKMPDNSRFAYLLWHDLPYAPIIWCRRNLLDNAVSYYAETFAAGHNWSYHLEELGRHIVAHERMMYHWQRVGVPMLEVWYEKIVDDVETETRRILTHLGLAWDPRCLGYHATERSVRTASISQVRQGIYNTSVGRWKTYEAQLNPLKLIFEQSLIC